MSWKTKTLLIYLMGGLVLGAVAGIMAVNNAEKNEQEPDFSLKKGAKIGIAAMDLIRKNVL